MALICMAVHDTEENQRTRYTIQTLYSLMGTVDFNRHRIVIVDNNSCIKTKEYLKSIARAMYITIINNNKNMGTAYAINIGLSCRRLDEVCIKMDNDVIVHHDEWIEELEQVFIDAPEIGICGLKRDDVYGDFTENGKLLMSDDIMGTCTAFNPKLLDAIGFMSQIGVYGFDDTIFSARSLAAGFRNAFLPHIKITHLDEGGTAYTDWKKREAGLYLNEVSNLINMYKTGQLSPYYDGGLDD